MVNSLFYNSISDASHSWPGLASIINVKNNCFRVTAADMISACTRGLQSSNDSIHDSSHSNSVYRLDLYSKSLRMTRFSCISTNTCKMSTFYGRVLSWRRRLTWRSASTKRSRRLTTASRTRKSNSRRKRNTRSREWKSNLAWMCCRARPQSSNPVWFLFA